MNWPQQKTAEQKKKMETARLGVAAALKRFKEMVLERYGDRAVFTGDTQVMVDEEVHVSITARPWGDGPTISIGLSWNTKDHVRESIRTGIDYDELMHRFDRAVENGKAENERRSKNSLALQRLEAVLLEAGLIDRADRHYAGLPGGGTFHIDPTGTLLKLSFSIRDSDPVSLVAKLQEIIAILKKGKAD